MRGFLKTGGASLAPFLAMALALAGCMAPVDTARAPDAQISTIALWDTEAFDGRWYEVAGVDAGGQGCTVGAITFARQASGDFFVTQGPCAGQPARQGQARVTAPGRMVLNGQDVWVLWVDADYQTAVIGAPDGRIGWILSRSRAIRADKLAAAKEILDWNGYDLSRLSVY